MAVTRNAAAGLLNEYIKNEKMLSRRCALEAVMRAPARKSGRDEEKSGFAGMPLKCN